VAAELTRSLPDSINTETQGDDAANEPRANLIKYSPSMPVIITEESAEKSGNIVKYYGLTGSMSTPAECTILGKEAPIWLHFCVLKVIRCRFSAIMRLTSHANDP
jgi:hypothetical protein